MKSEFTGKHMAYVMTGGFGIVVAVNLLMATLATSGFGGVVVKNSYVASQNFNDWLDTAAAQEALGWIALVKRDEANGLAVATQGVPESALVSADARRPLGERQPMALAFERGADGVYRSSTPLPAGRWIMRITISDDGHVWRREVRVE